MKRTVILERTCDVCDRCTSRIVITIGSIENERRG